MVKPSKIQPNQPYGKLTVIERDTNNPNRKPFWVCVCECGARKSVRADYLTSGRIISCGCYRADKFTSSSENIQQCTTLFEQGKTVEEISQIMRISPSNVQKFLSQSGTNISIPKSELVKYRDSDKLRWARKYVGYGMSLEAIAKAENTTIHTVLKALNKLGIPTREPGSQSPEMISRFRAKAQEYWQFYSQGMSLNQVAQLFNTSDRAVRYILKAHGYKTRSLKDAMKLRHRQRRIAFRKETRQLISDRGIKLSETRKASELQKIEKL